jgi:DNA-directed RNA polymerase specialized sigma24 family protein
VPSPVNEAIDQELHALVRRCKAQLPTRYQQVLDLRHVSGLPFASVGRALDISEGAAQSLCCRAVQALAERLQAQGFVVPGRPPGRRLDALPRLQPRTR